MTGVSVSPRELECLRLLEGHLEPHDPCASDVLARLRDLGLVERYLDRWLPLGYMTYRYRLTGAGRRVLDDAG